ncbi:MAG TPA: hypothetical protein VKB78_00510 [Pirellulales bacterium]|nr:hypothetical protein [Pirellulales bacterium]
MASEIGSPVAALQWLADTAREWSPAGTIRIYAVADHRYRVMFCPDQDGPPYFALVGFDGFWSSDQNWKIVSRHETLEQAKVACEQHSAGRAAD